MLAVAVAAVVESEAGADVAGAVALVRDGVGAEVVVFPVAGVWLVPLAAVTAVVVIEVVWPPELASAGAGLCVCEGGGDVVLDAEAERAANSASCSAKVVGSKRLQMAKKGVEESFLCYRGKMLFAGKGRKKDTVCECERNDRQRWLLTALPACSHMGGGVLLVVKVLGAASRRMTMGPPLLTACGRSVDAEVDVAGEAG